MIGERLEGGGEHLGRLARKDNANNHHRRLQRKNFLHIGGLKEFQLCSRCKGVCNSAWADRIGKLPSSLSAAGDREVLGSVLDSEMGDSWKDKNLLSLASGRVAGGGLGLGGRRSLGRCWT